MIILNNNKKINKKGRGQREQAGQRPRKKKWLDGKKKEWEKMTHMVSTVPSGSVSNASTSKWKQDNSMTFLFFYNASKQFNEMSFCMFKKMSMVQFVRIHVFIPEIFFLSFICTHKELFKLAQPVSHTMQSLAAATLLFK